ncbi:MAG TPA: hypothetical protein VFW07_16205 [Parafilimonas sp.]|nr:hypothetical protein [Parafilimonas sp.]
MHPHNVKREAQLFTVFNRVRSLYDLSFTYQEIFYNTIIGLDILRRKILIVEACNPRHDFRIIDLDEVNACCLKKIYSAVNSGYFEKNMPRENLEGIVLQFEFKRDRPPVVIAFLPKVINSSFNMAEVLYKGRQWEMLISKMLSFPEQKVA